MLQRQTFADMYMCVFHTSCYELDSAVICNLFSKYFYVHVCLTLNYPVFLLLFCLTCYNDGLFQGKFPITIYRTIKYHLIW